MYDIRTGYLNDQNLQFAVGLEGQPITNNLLVNSVKTALYMAIKLGRALHKNKVPQATIAVKTVGRYDLSNPITYFTIAYTKEKMVCYQVSDGVEVFQYRFDKKVRDIDNITGNEWVVSAVVSESFSDSYMKKIKALKKVELLPANNQIVFSEKTLSGVYNALKDINKHISSEITQEIKALAIGQMVVPVESRFFPHTTSTGEHTGLYMTNYHPTSKHAYLEVMYQYAVYTYCVLMNTQNNYLTDNERTRLNNLISVVIQDKNAHVVRNFEALQLFCTPTKGHVTHADVFALLYTLMIMEREKVETNPTLVMSKYIDEFVKVMS